MPKLNRTFAISLIFLSHLSFSQQLRFKQLNDATGLSSNQVTCLAQNKQGLMWIGTANGLNAYDGFRFRKFFHSGWDSTSLADSYIQCLFFDADNRLWTGGRGSISMLPTGSSKFRNFIIPGARKVYCFYQDDRNKIWVGSDNGLFAYNSTTNTFEKILDIPIYDLDLGNPFLTLTSRSAILGFDPTKNKITGNFTEQFTGLGGMVYLPSAVTVGHDQIYITNPASGFIIANTRKESYTRNDPFGPALFKPTCHQADSLGNIWVGCAKGLYVYDPVDSSTKKAYEYITTNESLLSNQHIISLFFDRSGALWAGTRDQGVFLSSTTKGAFLPCEAPVLKDSRILAVRGTERDLLVGTENNGFWSWNYPSGAAISLNKLPASKVNCIGATSDPDLYWIGTDKGLFAWQRSTNTFTLHKLYTDTLNQEVTSVAEMKDPNVWIGTTFGMIRYIPSTKDVFIFSHKTNDANSISEGRVNVVHSDKYNRIWAGTETGLDLFNLSVAKFEHYNATLNAIDPNISAITEDRSGNLWISVSNSGLIMLNPKTKKATNLVPDVFCQSTILDPANNAWLGTVGGLISLNPSGQYRNFTIADGLHAMEHMPGAATWLSNQKAAIGTSSGLYILNTQYYPARPDKFNFILSNVLLDGKPGEWKSNTLEIKPENKHITIQFGSNDYGDPASHHIQYRIEGLDKEWKNSLDGEIHLNNLNEGSYTLKVAELKGENHINEQTLLTIQVTPPFWNSFAFRILLTVVFLGLLWWLIRDYIRRMKRKEATKHELEKRVMRLELDAYKSQLDSQYIANIIQATQDSIGSGDMAMAHSYLSKFSSLISCLIEFADKEFISIDQLWKVLDYYLNIEKMRLGGQLDYLIEISPEIDKPKTFVPNMLVQPYVENAIYLGLKQKIQDRRVIVRFEPWSKNHVLCSIEDNGIGRKVAARMRSSKIDFHRTSHTKVAEERMLLLKETSKLETRLEVIDLFDGDGEASGTKVILHLPTQI